jgi:hypothetical protein
LLQAARSTAAVQVAQATRITDLLECFLRLHGQERRSIVLMSFRSILVDRV